MQRIHLFILGECVYLREQILSHYAHISFSSTTQRTPPVGQCYFYVPPTKYISLRHYSPSAVILAVHTLHGAHQAAPVRSSGNRSGRLLCPPSPSILSVAVRHWIPPHHMGKLRDDGFARCPILSTPIPISVSISMNLPTALLRRRFFLGEKCFPTSAGGSQKLKP